MANFKDIIEQSFGQYAGAVLQSRALVDVRDCIKPSARQIFYSMNCDKFTHNKPFKKTLKAVGSAMNYYIHGDASCVGIIMRAGQPFALRYPIIEVEGSYGNLMESGNWAAPRYTASRLSAISSNLFKDLEKETIDDWRDNYDDTAKYPAVLPSKGFYNIVNGTSGIGVAAASSIPQFNLKEVNEAIITLIKNPNATFDEVYCPPDFATAATIINSDEVKKSLRTGHGKACMIRATIEYNKKKNTLTVTEMPYGVYTNTICKELEKIVNGEDNPGIDSFNDLTGEKPCIRIYLDRGVDPERIKMYLYKNTSLQSSYGINMTMLEEGRFPKVFGWKEALESYVKHQMIVYRKGWLYDLRKIEYRLKIINGIIKAIAEIEQVIQIIKTSASTKDANEKLQSFLSIDEEQAKAILDIKLARLAKLEIEKYEQEKISLEQERDRINKILNDKELFNAEIIKDLRSIAEKYGDDRRTQLVNIEVPKTKEEKEAVEVIPEDVIVVLNQNGDIKRIPRGSYRKQNRGGKGIKSERAVILETISTNTQDNLMLFSSLGKMYKLLVDKIPVSTNAGRGVNILNLIQLGKGEEIVAATSLEKDSNAEFVVFFTKNGMVKKTQMDEFTSAKRASKGITAIKFKEGDSLANVVFMNEEKVLLLTKEGMGIKFESADINAIGRNTCGVKGIKLTENDEVLCGIPLASDSPIAIFSEDGKGKKVEQKDFPIQNRGGKGVNVRGKLVGGLLIEKNDSLLLSGEGNTICIPVGELPNGQRTSAGNQMIKVKLKKVLKI